ncbi:E3 SUMO-protein ligase ZBED1-like [Montipora capricornis]|uniref:E3 SUMO-protein ligase ZBED1-like n=1 Tax=Montipora capricornis TaxID=246305 RepID=UPI0035F13E41
MDGFVGKRLGINSDCAQNISKHIRVFIAHDLRPCSIVESPAFTKLLQVLEPRYKVPSRTVIPSLYTEVKKDVITGIWKAVSVALTTDGWPSRATESYITTTAHYISQDWKLENKVLETTTLPCSHTGEALREALNDTATRWNTKRQHEVPKLNQLVGRVRRVVSYFHQRPKPSHVLKEKLALLKIEGTKKLIIDVSTRWNSTYDMLQRFALLKPAVMATLMTKEVRKDIKDVYILSEDNTILKVTSPEPDDCVLVRDVKKAIHSDFLPRYEDPELRIFLFLATAIDPRFHSLPFISWEERTRVFAELAVNVEKVRKAVYTHLLQVKAEQVANASVERSETNPPVLTESLPQPRSLPVLPSLPQFPESAEFSVQDKREELKAPDSPPRKNTATSELFGDVFITSVEPGSGCSLQQQIEEDLCRFKCVPAIPGTSVPSERIFSTARDIVNAQRACLSPENL